MTGTHCDPLELLTGNKYLENDFETRVAKELLDVWHRCSIGCVISVGPNEYARATQQGWVATFNGRPTTWQRLLIHIRDGALLDRTFTIESVSEWKVDDPKPYIEHALTNRKYARAFIGVISKCESWNAQIQEIMQAVIRAYTDGQDRIRHWSNIGPGKRPTDLPPTDIDAATLHKVNAGLAWIGAMRSVCSHESTKLKIRGKGEEPLAWEDVDDRVMAQRIRANDSVIIFEVIGLANYGVKCSIEITSAAQDIRNFMCRETLWMDPKGIEAWMGLVQAIMTQPGCAELHCALGMVRDKILKGERKLPSRDEEEEEEEEEEEDAYGSDYEDQTW